MAKTAKSHKSKRKRGKKFRAFVEGVKSDAKGGKSHSQDSTT